MSRNSSGTYILPSPQNPVVENTVITTDWANTTLSDLATEITDSLNRSGKGGMLAPIRGVDGTLSAPSYSFSSDTNTGFARLANASVSAIVDGAEIVRFGTSAINLNQGGSTVVSIGTSSVQFASGCRPQWSGTPSNAIDLVTKSYADSLSFSAALPNQTGAAGKVIRSNGTAASWSDAWGAPVALNSGGSTLSARTAYHADTSSAAFSVNLPASPSAGDWVIIRDVGRNCGVNNLTLSRNGSLVYGQSVNYVMDVSGEAIILVFDSTKGWVRG